MVEADDVDRDNLLSHHNLQANVKQDFRSGNNGKSITLGQLFILEPLS